MQLISHARRSFAPMMILVTVSLLASGCLKISTTLTVNDDGSGEYFAQLDVDREFLEFMTQAGDEGEYESPEAVCTDILASTVAEWEAEPEVSLPAGVTASRGPYNDPASCGISQTVEWTAEVGAATENYADLLTLGDAEGSAPANEMGAHDLVRTDEGWYFRQEIADLNEFDNTLDANQTEGLDALMQLMGVEPLSIVMTLTLPGYPHDHNATSVDGSKLTWEFGLNDAPAEIYASYSDVPPEDQPERETVAPTEETEPDVTAPAASPDVSSATREGADEEDGNVLVAVLAVAAVIGVVYGLATLVRRRSKSGGE